jgi:hypothetical protein
VQSYLAALLHNGQIVGDHAPMAKVSGGLLVTASLPEVDALADASRTNGSVSVFGNFPAVGVERPKVTHLGATLGAARQYRTPSREPGYVAAH